MLLPEQVVPFLQHDDPIVREHVLNYFRDSYQFGPLTADHYWAVIDRLGENDSTIGFASALYRLPQTATSVDRLLSAVTKKSPEDFKSNYAFAIRWLDLAVLQPHRDRLLALPLKPTDRKLIELRLSLVDTAPSEAWQSLMQIGRELGDAYAGDFDSTLSKALTEAAGRGDSAVCEQAIAALRDEETHPWCAIFSARVLGLARYEPAVDALVETLAIDTDLLCEDACRTLARIGTPHVVDRIVDFYPGKPWHVRLYAHGPLAGIKSELSESGLLKMLEVELAREGASDTEDEGEPFIEQILSDLVDLCSLAGLEETRRQIERYPGNPDVMSVCEGLLATATMTGATLPDDADWRPQVLEARQKFQRQRPYFRSLLRNLDEPVPTASRQVDGSWTSLAEPLKPIRNAAPKVGRNDPCPCGSGKKYKKCCGK